jgi:hypothetical protein
MRTERTGNLVIRLIQCPLLTLFVLYEPCNVQVSKLIILHEEGEDGNAMPDLQGPVQAETWNKKKCKSSMMGTWKNNDTEKK